MKDILQSALANDALARATHWTVFGIGLISLSVSIAATLANALGL
ncbi:hypothetical protein [Albirhodobacter sp. R86504]|jgi:hypothetical protein